MPSSPQAPACWRVLRYCACQRTVTLSAAPSIPSIRALLSQRCGRRHPRRPQLACRCSGTTSSQRRRCSRARLRASASEARGGRVRRTAAWPHTRRTERRCTRARVLKGIQGHCRLVRHETLGGAQGQPARSARCCSVLLGAGESSVSGSIPPMRVGHAIHNQVAPPTSALTAAAHSHICRALLPLGSESVRSTAAAQPPPASAAGLTPRAQCRSRRHAGLGPPLKARPTACQTHCTSYVRGWAVAWLAAAVHCRGWNVLATARSREQHHRIAVVHLHCTRNQTPPVS